MLKQKVQTISTLTFFVLLSLFYLLIFSHKQVLLMLPAIVYFVLVYVVIPSFIVYGYSLKRYIMITKGERLKRVVVLYSIIIIFLFLKIYVFGTSAKQMVIDFLSSQYMVTFHAFWLISVIILLYTVIFESIRQVGKYNDFIQSFKAFPLFSPIFCFGAPVFWEDSLLKLGISQVNMRFLGGISFIAGCFFMIALLLFYVSFHLEKNSNIKISLLQTDSLHKGAAESLSLYSLLCIFLGLVILTFVCLEISYYVLVNSLL